MGSKAKDAAAKLHEKHQTILADLLRDEENRFCADCKAKGPRWASWNLGVFVCIRCAGIHRHLGVHISRVKSVNLDSWTPEQIEAIQKGGNRQAREKYEANLPANFRRPQDDYAVEQFIRAKYERKQYISRDGDRSKATAAEQDQRPKVKKTVEKKAPPPITTPKNQVLGVPRPSGSSRRASSPQPAKLNTPTSPISKSSSARNLISLDSSKTQQQTPDLLTGLAAPTSPVRTSASSPNLVLQSKQSSDLFGSHQLSVNQAQPKHASSSGQIPSLMQETAANGAGGGVKDSIMSLYNVQRPQYNSFTAQGYPVNAYYYQQQQQAAMRMAMAQQQQQQHVQQVQQQMEQIKIRQQHQPVAVGNGSVPPPGASFGGGQTLNPHLW